MKATSKKVSATRLQLFCDQGFNMQTDQELCDLAFGHRFAFKFCTILMAIGIASANIHFLSVLILVSLFSVVLRYHVFDYVYNYELSNPLNKPKLPRRSMQLVFVKFLVGFTDFCLHTLIYNNIFKKKD